MFCSKVFFSFPFFFSYLPSFLIHFSISPFQSFLVTRPLSYILSEHAIVSTISQTAGDQSDRHVRHVSIFMDKCDWHSFSLLTEIKSASVCCYSWSICPWSEKPFFMFFKEIVHFYLCAHVFVSGRDLWMWLQVPWETSHADADSLDIDIHAVVSCLMWVLGTERRASVKIVKTLNSCANLSGS